MHINSYQQQPLQLLQPPQQQQQQHQQQQHQHQQQQTGVVWKRDEQLRRWMDSDTNKQPVEPVRSATKVNFQQPCIFLASCASGDCHEVLELLNRGVDVNTANIDGMTALHQACIDGNLEIVKFLAYHGADINFQDNEGWSPLHAASSCDNLDIAKFLASAGADVGSCTADGELAVDLADGSDMSQYLEEVMASQGVSPERCRNVEHDRMLADARSMVEKHDNKLLEHRHARTGATCLHVAAAKGYNDIVKLLLDHGADPNSPDNEGWTPLHAAAHWDHADAVRMLMESGADSGATNGAGQQVWDVCEEAIFPTIMACKTHNKRVSRIRDNGKQQDAEIASTAIRSADNADKTVQNHMIMGVASTPSTSESSFKDFNDSHHRKGTTSNISRSRDVTTPARELSPDEASQKPPRPARRNERIGNLQESLRDLSERYQSDMEEMAAISSLQRLSNSSQNSSSNSGSHRPAPECPSQSDAKVMTKSKTINEDLPPPPPLQTDHMSTALRSRRPLTPLPLRVNGCRDSSTVTSAGDHSVWHCDSSATADVSKHNEPPSSSAVERPTANVGDFVASRRSRFEPTSSREDSGSNASTLRRISSDGPPTSSIRRNLSNERILSYYRALKSTRTDDMYSSFSRTPTWGSCVEPGSKSSPLSKFTPSKSPTLSERYRTTTPRLVGVTAVTVSSPPPLKITANVSISSGSSASPCEETGTPMHQTQRLSKIFTPGKDEEAEAERKKRSAKARRERRSTQGVSKEDLARALAQASDGDSMIASEKKPAGKDDGTNRSDGPKSTSVTSQSVAHPLNTAVTTSSMFSDSYKLATSNSSYRQSPVMSDTASDKDQAKSQHNQKSSSNVSDNNQGANSEEANNDGGSGNTPKRKSKPAHRRATGRIFWNEDTKETHRQSPSCGLEESQKSKVVNEDTRVQLETLKKNHSWSTSSYACTAAPSATAGHHHRGDSVFRQQAASRTADLAPEECSFDCSNSTPSDIYELPSDERVQMRQIQAMKYQKLLEENMQLKNEIERLNRELADRDNTISKLKSKKDNVNSDKTRIAALTQDNERLKDENATLIRVISRLSR